MTSTRRTPTHNCALARARPRFEAARTLAFALALAVGATACQERPEPTVSLTQEQWKRVKQFVSDTAPVPDVPIGATFGIDRTPYFELVGYSLEPDKLSTGTNFTLTWYWRSLREVDTNYKIFVHLNADGAFQNLDHHPVDHLYQTSLWQKGQVVADVQTAQLQAGFPSDGSAKLGVGFFDERTGERLTIVEQGQGTAVEDGAKLEVGEVGTVNDRHLVVHKVATPPVLDGMLNDPAWTVAERTKPFVTPTDGKPVDFNTTVRAVYTDDALYFAFEASDRDLRTSWTRRDEKLFEQDCVEIFLNPDNDDGTYWELQISPGDGVGGKTPIFDAYFEKRRSPAWEVAIAADLPGMEVGLRRQGTLNSTEGVANDSQYVIEAKIPFLELTQAQGAIDTLRFDEIPPPVGSRWRVNFYRVDYEDTKAAPNRTRHAAWAPAGGDFHNLDAFGIVEFGAPKQLGAQNARTADTPARLTITALGTRNVDVQTVRKAGAVDEAAIRECIASAPNPPEERAEFRFDINVDADATITGIVRQNPDTTRSDVYGCIEKIVGAWDTLALAPPMVRPPAGAPKGTRAAPDESWDPKAVEATLGFTLAVIYAPGAAQRGNRGRDLALPNKNVPTLAAPPKPGDPPTPGPGEGPAAGDTVPTPPSGDDGGDPRGTTKTAPPKGVEPAPTRESAPEAPAP